MSDKLPWDKIRDDFKQRHPTLAKQIYHVQPYGYATVEIWLRDGMILAYNYDEHRADILCACWEEHRPRGFRIKDEY